MNYSFHYFEEEHMSGRNMFVNTRQYNYIYITKCIFSSFNILNIFCINFVFILIYYIIYIIYIYIILI